MKYLTPNDKNGSGCGILINGRDQMKACLMMWVKAWILESHHLDLPPRFSFLSYDPEQLILLILASHR